MKAINKNRLHLIAIGLLSIFVFAILLVFNYLYPVYSDDWGNVMVFGGPGNQSDYFSNIIESRYTQYFAWGGRVVVHVIAQSLLFLDPYYHDIINALAYTTFVFILYRICNVNRKANAFVFVFTASLLWIFVPRFASDVLWITGSANYLWGAIIVMLFITPHYLYYAKKSSAENKSGWIKLVAFFLFGIVAGWTNENMFVAQLFLIISTSVLLKKEERYVPSWFIAGIVGLCIGGAFMLLAPGNFVRSEMVNESLGLADKSVLYNIGYRLLKMGHRYVLYVLPATAVYLILFYFNYREKKNDVAGKIVLRGSLLFFAASHVACFAMAASPIFPPRATFGIVVLMIVGIGILYANTNFKKEYTAKLNYALLMILSVYCLLSLYGYYNHLQVMHSEFAKRDEYIKQEIALGNKDIVFTKKVVLPEEFDFEDFSSDPHYFLNEKYAAYSGVDSVRMMPMR